ncbi:MAG: DUF2069 domain-containing protein [Halopseudomonas sp.]
MAMIKNKLSVEQLSQRIFLSGLATRLQLFGLILTFALWTLWIAPPQGANPLVIWLVQSFLLLAFVPFIFKQQPRPFIWLCFVILFYFCAGVLNALQGSWSGILQTLLSTGIFCSAMMYARWKSLLNGIHQQPASTAADDSANP